jgi:hypothetical protein
MAKDIFDFEWVTDLAPRKVVSALSFAALVTLALVPATRVWFIDQAVHHAQHELQPLIDQIVTQMMSTGHDAPK